MGGRTRSEVISNDFENYTQQYYYSTQGSCSSDPGEPIYPYGTFSAGGSVQTLYELRSMTDVVTPEFHKLKKKGIIVNNPMTSTYVKLSEDLIDLDINWAIYALGCTPQRMYHQQNYKITGKRSISSLLSSPLNETSFSVDIDRLKDLAITKAWSRIGADEMLGLSAVAEAGDTVRGLAQLLGKVARILHALKRAKLKQLRRELSPLEFQELYMNARYNLRPLYYDVKAIHKILKKGYSEAA
jgi:hypothetical protein